MRMWEVHELQSRPLHELFAYLDELKKQTKEYKISYYEVDELLLELDEIDFAEHLGKTIQSDHKKGEYVFPFADQQKAYKDKTFLGHDILPAKGFFWRFETIKKEYPFGLVDVRFQMLKVQLASDMKHWGESRVYKEDKQYYYDYENERFVHVNTKRDSEEKAKWEERKALYLQLRKRLENENQTYLYQLEHAAKELGDHLLFTETNTKILRKKLFTFTQACKKLTVYLPIKTIFNQIDDQHFEHIKKHLHTLLKEAEECLEFLRDYEEKGYEDIMGSPYATDLRYIELHQSHETHRIKEARDKVVAMFRMKNPSVLDTRPLDGYYAYDTNRLYENLVQIEIEQARQLQSETRTTRRNEKANLLEKLKKKKS